ncbi:MAG TPA: pantetheine-phosphate adenylyltransferase [Candidatus Nanopelagicaceae bacterium]|nr:pantetheine-phosphate adenylyltransferase [Candidatus Nanopelagicaceae bacterium]
MTAAVYPGSFDPIHQGHLDVIERAGHIFDRVVVGVLDNSLKACLFSAEERAQLVRESLPPGSNNVEVVHFSGLAVSFAVSQQAGVIVRGLRAVSDLDSEFQMALMNRRLEPRVHTVFLTTGFANVYLSSSLIKDVCAHGGSIEGLVAPSVAEALRRKLAPGADPRLGGV